MKRFTVWVAKKSGELLEVVPVLYEAKSYSQFSVDPIGSYDIRILYAREDSIAGYLVSGQGMKTFQFIEKDLFEKYAEYLGEL